MQLLSLFALLPALAIAVPVEQQIEARGVQNSSVSVITKTVTVTETVCNWPWGSKSTASSSSVGSASSKSAVPSSSAKAVSSAGAVSSSSGISRATSSSTATSMATSKPVVPVTPASSSKSAVSASSTPTSSAAASATPSGGLSASDIDALLKLHNDFRKLYGANPVTWDTTLADYASKAAQTCKYGHTGGPYGENIAAGVGGGYNLTSAFNSWGPNEAPKYNYSAPGFTDAAGHFTQIVWKSTTKIGCAAANCTDGTIFSGYGRPSLYVVCEYDPAGNIVGDNGAYFQANVGAKVAPA